MDTNVLQMAINAVRGKVDEKFSAKQTSEGLRAAFIQMNGGSTKINPKNFYRGNQLFELIEELIPVIIEEGLKDDDILLKLVEYKNIKDGDINEFYVEDNSLFVVANAAAGIQGVRRQRLSGGSKTSIDTEVKLVRVYDELNRLLAGRVDFNDFVDRVSTSFKKQILADAYKAIDGISANTAGLGADYVVSGTFDEDNLLTLIAHVEAATGKTAKIYGTKTALRKISTAVVSDEAKSDLYTVGYYGKFNGTDMVCLRQAHKSGTNSFVFNDNKIYVIAGDDKPVKMVNEGEGILFQKDPSGNADVTQEYTYGQAYGTGVICAEKIGIYTIGS